ncbi:MAG: hypothetical protein LIP01_10020 [Tannerellaceae bacterium]|nr:hypothetical protein [Tannerellaceae bacterium]
MKDKMALLLVCICIFSGCSRDDGHGNGGNYTGEETEVAFLPRPNGLPLLPMA